MRLFVNVVTENMVSGKFFMQTFKSKATFLVYTSCYLLKHKKSLFESCMRVRLAVIAVVCVMLNVLIFFSRESLFFFASEM